IEFPARDLAAAERFYSETFQWKFTSYGPEYVAFNDGKLDGGFYAADLKSQSESGGALVILYSGDLEATQALVEANGGVICKPIFSFPGGRRFQFLDPNGNELAVWTDQGL
ncbi:MAG: VOC family protein, partial [Planctomycetota bacterium]